MSNIIRFLVLGDLHGEIPKIKVDLNEIDAIITTGDFSGDEIRIHFEKLRELRKLKNDNTISIEEIISMDEIKNLEKKSFEQGKKVLEYLNLLNKPVFVVPGNWDSISEIKINPKIEKVINSLKNINNIHGDLIEFKGINLIGYGLTSAPEYLEELYVSDFENEQDYIEYLVYFNYFIEFYLKLLNLFENSKNPIIFLSHNVPFDTKLDILNNSNLEGVHYGSFIVRNLIDDFQPLVSIGGHIHEGVGDDWINNTKIINAGYGPDINIIIEIDLKNFKVLKMERLGKNKE